jgi:hypothetical protein
MEKLAFEYLDAIGCGREERSLQALIEGHLKRFFYCNLWLWHEGRKPVENRVVLASENVFEVWEDLKRDGFGYCFQLIEVQKAVLSFLGFNLSRHASIPVNLAHDLVDEVALAGRHCSHEILMTKSKRDLSFLFASFFHFVLIGGDIIDVGYGPNALTGVLSCRVGSEGTCGDNLYRILAVAQDDKWLQLEVFLPSGWTALYRFAVESTELVKPMAAGTLLLPNRIPIRDDFVYIAKCLPERRKWLYIDAAKKGGTWKVIEKGRTVEERRIEKWDEMIDLVAREFDWKVDERLKDLFA